MATLRRNGGGLIPALPQLWGDDFFTRDLMNWGLYNYSTTGTTIPTVNITEEKDSFEVEVAAPGLRKNDFNIELDGNTLTISAEKEEKREQKEPGQRYICREFSYQSFQRSFNLPKDVVDIEKIKAHYEDGVLQLSIPKKEVAKVKQHKMITVA